ncbi:FAD-binding Berberine family protein [Prunus dulcis]|uniref:FAD-binding Berberine family protein n=1 Tax=Prunus dulcis TaxID=3755 RepID=A0A4Y1QW13_PRUDU|nr:FAD-binding Berberine family protein [Prunus dulcis]
MRGNPQTLNSQISFTLPLKTQTLSPNPHHHSSYADHLLPPQHGAAHNFKYFGPCVDVVHFLQWLTICNRVLQESDVPLLI